MRNSIAGDYVVTNHLPAVMNHAPPLLVFADDWGRHPSSCQYLIRELLTTHYVTWVNTIGTRPAKLNWATFKRGLGKLKQWGQVSGSASSVSFPDNLQVLNPKMWPGFTTHWQRRLNQWLLKKHLLPVIQKMAQSPIAITTIPIIADVMEQLPVRSWVYYCVDDFSQWPGLDGNTLGSMELEMLPKADCIVAASEHLQERLLKLGYHSELLTHGVDIDFWSNAAVQTGITGLDKLERPLIVFWGVVDQRMDLSFVKLLAEELMQGTIVLAGPEDEPFAELKQLARVKMLGKLPLDALPSLAADAAVLIMPYDDLPVTRAMQPLKLKEYLATGRPAVVRDLPANRAWSDCLDLVQSPREFVQKVQMRIHHGIPSEQIQARIRLKGESWQSKAETFASFLCDKHNKRLLSIKHSGNHRGNDSST